MKKGIFMGSFESRGTIIKFGLLLALLILFLRLPGHFTTHNWHEYVIHRIRTQEKVVALTFDDGPHPVYTKEILDILDQYQVKATFFMIGKLMKSHPEIVREVLARGHVIANHTYTHPHNIEADSPGQIRAELEQCEGVIERITARGSAREKRGYLFRPPLGLVDNKVFTITRAEGYRTILWNVSADHHDAPTPEKMAERVLKLTRPGTIILAHDGRIASRWKDVAATRIFVKGLIKEGYRFVTVPELLKIRAQL